MKLYRIRWLVNNVFVPKCPFDLILIRARLHDLDNFEDHINRTFHKCSASFPKILNVHSTIDLCIIIVVLKYANDTKTLIELCIEAFIIFIESMHWYIQDAVADNLIRVIQLCNLFY